MADLRYTVVLEPGDADEGGFVVSVPGIELSARRTISAFSSRFQALSRRVVPPHPYSLVDEVLTELLHSEHAGQNLAIGL